MAKPLNPYQGAAPAAMAQMGQGILEAGANIGRTLQGGYESMGKGIAGGITAAADAYKQYKDEQAKFDATKKMFKIFSGSLNEKERQGIDEIFADTSMSVREKNALAPTLMQYLGASQQQKQALERQKAELDAAWARTQFSENAATGRTKLGNETQKAMPFYQAAANTAGGEGTLAPSNYGLGRGSTPGQSDFNVTAPDWLFRNKGTGLQYK